MWTYLVEAAALDEAQHEDVALSAFAIKTEMMAIVTEALEEAIQGAKGDRIVERHWKLDVPEVARTVDVIQPTRRTPNKY